MRLSWVAAGGVVVLFTVAVRYYVAWQRGDDIRVPGVGIVRRFPCGDYRVPPTRDGLTQALTVIDTAALDARSNTRKTVAALVDAVFDRELPGIRCGNRLRRRVTEAEWRFRNGTRPPITEQALADASNSVLKTTSAPAWARTSAEELHFIRTVLRKRLPQFVSTADSGSQPSEKMSPIEAVFVVMTIGRGMVLEPDQFLGGPDAYVARARERQLSPPQSGAVLRGQFMVRGIVDLANGEAFEDQHTLAATSAHRFLDQLGFPR